MEALLVDTQLRHTINGSVNTQLEASKQKSSNEFKWLHAESEASDNNTQLVSQREKFERALEDAHNERILPKAYYSAFDKDEKFNDLLFEEYDKMECVGSLNIIRTLLAVEHLDFMFQTDCKEPIRYAKAISKLLNTVDTYIKDKTVCEIVKSNYINRESGYSERMKTKIVYNLELLSS